MPIAASFDDYYAAINVPTTSITINFGFGADDIRIANDGATTVHFTRKPLTNATTDHPGIASGDIYQKTKPDGAVDLPTSISLVAVTSSCSVRIWAHRG